MGPEFGNVQLRVSIFPTVLGEKVVCRIFDPTTRSFDIDRLGLEPETKEKFIQLINKPNGLILLTGPTGRARPLPFTARCITSSKSTAPP